MLNALQANDSLYTVLAYQPEAHIQIGQNGIRNRDQDLAERQVGALLNQAISLHADLVVCPEYCVPWKVLVSAVENGLVPEPGRLWILGCESIGFDELDVYRTRLNDIAKVLDEPISQQAITTQQYRNPLVYVFRAQSIADDSWHTVLLVQYKTIPSGDPANTEAQGMLNGSRVYIFGRKPAEVRLMTLNCSDAFGFTEQLVNEYYDGLLLVHLQMNGNPSQARYIAYRSQLFQSRDDRTEIISLNWAENIQAYDEAGRALEPWRNIAGSGWYLRPSQVDVTDAGINHNHKHGLYFSRQEEMKLTALLFHYQPRLFHLRATKVFHHAVQAPKSYRTGPSALGSYIWDNANGTWKAASAAASPDDGFKSLLESLKPAAPLTGIEDAYATSPLHVERLATVSSGTFGPDPDWHSPPLCSVRLCSREILHRVTVTLDPRASGFRSERIAALRAIESAGAQGFAWPPEVGFLSNGFSFHWESASPHTNLLSVNGDYATVIYAGQSGLPERLQALDTQVRRAIAGKSPPPSRVLSQEEKRDMERAHLMKVTRICILYSDGQRMDVYKPSSRAAYNVPATYNPVDIANPGPRTANSTEEPGA